MERGRQALRERKLRTNWIYVFMAVALLVRALGVLKGNAAQAFQSGVETLSAGNMEREAGPGTSGLTQLQIPQRMEIVIDPWEMDGREQVYSEEYTVQNTGKTTGILMLDFSCEIREETGLSFRDNLEGLHYSGEKLIYMKALFGNGDETVFTQEGIKYQVELHPGEILSLRFTGEVNENAEESWKDGDIRIEGMYSWEGEADQSNEGVEGIPETEKDETSENILPSKPEQDNDVKSVLSNDPAHGNDGEEQVSSSEVEEETIRDSSLSGNNLEE